MLENRRNYKKFSEKTDEESNVYHKEISENQSGKTSRADIEI